MQLGVKSSEQTMLLRAKTKLSEKIPYASAGAEVARDATKDATSSGTGGAKAATEVEEEEEGVGGTNEQPTQANHPPTMQGTSHQYPPCEFYKVHACGTHRMLPRSASI